LGLRHDEIDYLLFQAEIRHMSDLASCCSNCGTQIAPLSIPGPQGAAGAAGANGTNGTSAFTTTTAQTGPTPADTTTAYTIPVASSVQFVVGTDLIIGQGPGAILANPGPLAVVITAIPAPNSITVKNLRVVDQGVTVSSGALVAPIGFLPAVPLTIAQGGTNAITKAAAQISLALGQDSVVSSGAALAQGITAVNAQVGAIDVQLPAALAGTGALEIRGFVSIDVAAVTFAAAPRTITAKIRNITQGVDLVSGIVHMQNTAASSFPTHFLVIPPVKYTTGVAGDHLQMFILVDIAITGGTLTVDAGSLEVVPLRLS
jgi:hypothetical protein